MSHLSLAKNSVSNLRQIWNSELAPRHFLVDRVSQPLPTDCLKRCSLPAMDCPELPPMPATVEADLISVTEFPEYSIGRRSMTMPLLMTNRTRGWHGTRPPSLLTCTFPTCREFRISISEWREFLPICRAGSQLCSMVS